MPTLLAAILSLGFSTGCTSALTTAYLKGLPWDAGEHAAEIRDETTAGATDDGPDDADPSVAAGMAAVADSEEAAAAARAAAVEEAVGRLASLGTLDAETQATLVAALQRTSQEDWPAVVDEFAAVLAASAPRIAAKPEAASPPTPPSSSPSVPAPPAPEPESTAELAAEPPLPSPPSPAAEPVEVAEPATSAEPDDGGGAAALTGPSLAVHNACFASRVQAWGLVDRFASARFRPGQEVIVYFELEHLSATESAAGHTTCIDTSLALVAADGRRLHAWHFEPIAETCPSRRRDYFARYVLRFPDDVPAGDCRVEVAVTDTLSGTTATTTLPLAIAAD